MLGHLQRIAYDRPHVADGAMAVVVWVVASLTTTTGDHLRDGVAVALSAVACAALFLRRYQPYAVLLVSTVAAEGYLARVAGGGGTLILAAPLIALYTVSERAARKRSLLVTGLLVLLIGAFHTMARPERWLGPENIALAALGGLAVAAGEASRNRRAYVAETLLRAQERVTEDRLRIARDLHDSVGHHLALINVQAGVAGHVLTEAPQPLRDTLEQIRVSSRSALDELRDAVGLLRRADEPFAPTEPALDLGQLLASFEGCGLPIAYQPAEALPPAAERVAFRVVQEALTNVRKHAGAAPVRVRLERERSELVIEVVNDGPMVPDTAPGHGLTGMRERVTALGGTLRAGPRPEGGFRVTARLPA